MTSFNPIRPPATPLIVRNPYVSVWLAGDSLVGNWPTFWQGTTKAICGIALIDGNPYVFMGNPAGIGSVGTMTQTNLTVTATQSIFTFQAGGITLILTFLSPIEARDIQRQSIPLGYVAAKVKSNDGKTHTVSLYFDISAEWSHSDTTQQVTWTRSEVPHGGGFLTSLTFNLVAPQVLAELSDYSTWGKPVWATVNATIVTSQIGADTVVRAQAAQHGVLTNAIDTAEPRAINNAWPVLGFNFALGSVGNSMTAPIVLALGHVRTPAVSYLGQQLNPLWQSYWSSADQMLAFFYDDYAGAQSRAEAFDARVNGDAARVGGPEYAALCALAARQACGGTELVNGPANTPWLLLKEISSDGNVSTVDVIYPAFPFFLYSNPDLVQLLLNPILTYCESGQWPRTYCVHDLGAAYPNATGHNDGGGENMPVEETANMLVMGAAYLERADPASARAFAVQHYRIFRQWANYLAADNGQGQANALDPLIQNQTDDFTGLIAHSTNLALKGIIGIGAMSILAQVAGNDNDDATYYYCLAAGLMAQWANLAQDPGEAHQMLAYIEPDNLDQVPPITSKSWSQKYNSYPATLLQLRVIPQNVLDGETSWYVSKVQTYGIPLDSRHMYTKADWELWTAAGMGDPVLRQDIINRLYQFANTTPQRVPFTDYYDSQSGDQVGFQARPVIGGLFALVSLTAGSSPLTGSCKIVNRNSNKVLTPLNWSIENGASIVQWTDNGTLDHNWHLVDNGNGYYRIINTNNGKVLTPAGLSTSDGAAVVQWDDNGTGDHLWQLLASGNGYYRIRNYNSGKVLTPSNWAVADGAPIVQWDDNHTPDHDWQFSPLQGPVIIGANYKIANQNSRKVLTPLNWSTADDAQIVQWADNGTVDHLWKFIDAGGGYYIIKSSYTGKVLTPANWSVDDGAAIVQYDDNGTIDHLWQVIPVGIGYYRIKNYNSGKVLTPSNWSIADGAAIVQWDDNGTIDHNWSFVLS
jgi:Domain of unknown function (DUF5127)/Domain of unknown function (DUF4965)/Domain of unknown function (DUF1793)/Ricin-type beta-trefoil lectin domain-like/Domain of unknown function (DUF4964)